MISVQVLEQHKILCSEISVTEAQLPLTFFDIVWLFTGPVERVFLFEFKHSTGDFIIQCLPNLKASFLSTVSRFWPLAARVKPSNEDHKRFEIDFSGDDDSCLFSVAECGADFDELCTGNSKEFDSVYCLIPQILRHEDGSMQLMSIQVTVFPYKGIAIGVSIHHVACDDNSAVQFMKAWAVDCISGGSNQFSISPSFDRSVIQDSDGLYCKIFDEIQALMAGGPPPPPASLPVSSRNEIVIASFSISRRQIEKLKESVVLMVGGEGNLHLSTFSVACGFAWKCLVRVQKEFYATKDSAHLLFSVECRGRLSPPVPQGYFGNCLRPCFVEVSMDDLLNNENGAFIAAEAIGMAIKGLDDGVLVGAESWLQKIISLGPCRPLSIAGSPKYGVYDVDFGWGKPLKVEMTSIKKTPGTISMAENKESGGIEIGLVLPKPEMDEFSSCFQQSLMLL